MTAPIPDARWLHCGSSCHIRPEGQRALKAAVQRAAAASVRISFDPNVRVHLWRNLGALRALCESVFPACTLVKLSEDECETCVGERMPEKAAERLRDMGVPIACITLGERGAIALRDGRWFRAEASRVKVVDTTGAGDGFVAGLLSRLVRDPEPSDDVLQSNQNRSRGRYNVRLSSGPWAENAAVEPANADGEQITALSGESGYHSLMAVVFPSIRSVSPAACRGSWPS